MPRSRVRPRLASRALLLCASVVLGACGGGDEDTGVTPPGNTPVAARLAVATAPSAPAESRVALASQPVVGLQDANGNPVSQPGVSVTATITGVAATLTGATATTGADGRATFTSLTIAGRAGVRTITFSASGLTTASAPVTLVAGRPALLGALVPQTQTGTSGIAVAAAPSVRLMDADSNAIAGATVTFTVAGGGGSVTGGSAVTNASGVATVGAWTLGATAGTNTLTAATTALPAVSVVFTATGAALTGRELLTFAFPKAANGTSVDGDVTIAGTNVMAFLPPGTGRTALKPAFTVSPGATVSVNGVTQTSGVSAVNFTGPVTYVVRAPDLSTASYTVTLTTDIASIDDLMTAFMAKYNVPGLSFAITHDENLVYAKAYGRADATTPLTTSHLFRIASLAKPITSAAIMRLVDQGKLTLDQKVFGPGSILGTAYGAPPYRPGIADITVDHLLYHAAGGWTNDGNDPMFKNPAMTADQLITWTIANQALLNAPGTNYAYSNFGYSILGRVIEKLTGQPYADAVKTLILTPAGISAMRIGGNALADRMPNEVVYTSQAESAYGFNLARMDAHGGWIASAVDLAKFLARVDGGGVKPDLLSPGALTAMGTASPTNTGYARGWSTNGPNWWHTGGLPGTGSEMARITSHGRYNFVILTNSQAGGNFYADLDKLFWDARAATTRWPAYDLFAAFP